MSQRVESHMVFIDTVRSLELYVLRPSGLCQWAGGKRAWVGNRGGWETGVPRSTCACYRSRYRCPGSFRAVTTSDADSVNYGSVSMYHTPYPTPPPRCWRIHGFLSPPHPMFAERPTFVWSLSPGPGERSTGFGFCITGVAYYFRSASI